MKFTYLAETHVDLAVFVKQAVLWFLAPVGFLFVVLCFLFFVGWLPKKRQSCLDSQVVLLVLQFLTRPYLSKAKGAKCHQRNLKK